jgi:hypothetical protein
VIIHNHNKVGIHDNSCSSLSWKRRAKILNSLFLYYFMCKSLYRRFVFELMKCHTLFIRNRAAMETKPPLIRLSLTFL